MQSQLPCSTGVTSPQDVSTEVPGCPKALLSRGGLLSIHEVLGRDLEVSLPAHYCSLMAILVFFFL